MLCLVFSFDGLRVLEGKGIFEGVGVFWGGGFGVEVVVFVCIMKYYRVCFCCKFRRVIFVYS